MHRRAAAALVATIGIVLALAGTASAHPLGNFTTNHYAEVVLSGDRAYVVYVLDLAEIPTFQAKPRVAGVGRKAYADDLAHTIASGLHLEIDGARRPLVALERDLSFPAGAAGLRTTRLELVLDAGRVEPGGPHELTIRDVTFTERLGWREIAIRAERGAVLTSSSAPNATVSDRLRAYPGDLLSSPLEVRSAQARVEAGDDAGVAPRLDRPSEAGASRPTSASEGGFAALIEERRAQHRRRPRCAAGRDVLGRRTCPEPRPRESDRDGLPDRDQGRPRDALMLGGIVTVTHTIGVFALGFVTLGLSQFIVPEDLYPWLNLVSAVLVVLVGVAVFRQRILAALRPAGHHHDGHHHPHHGHDHHHEGMTEEEHARAHLPQEGSGARGLVAVGVSGGLIPCPTALVVLLAAVSLHRVAFGLVLIVAFSVGLAAVISGIGLVAIGARQTFSRMSFEGPLVRALPTVSALVILVVGVAMTVRALPGIV